MLNGDEQALSQDLSARVLRQVQQVEACVRHGEEGVASVCRLDEDLDSLHAQDRDPVRAGQERLKETENSVQAEYTGNTSELTQELFLLFNVEFVKDMPEVLNNRMLGRIVALVLGVLLELGEVVVLVADDHGH